MRYLNFKRFLIIASVLFFVCGYFQNAEAVNKVRAFTALTGGGTGALDAISISALTDGDISFVVSGNYFYIYEFNASATDAESSPQYIRPDDYSSQGVWYLTTMSGVTFTSVTVGGFPSNEIIQSDGSGNLEGSGKTLSGADATILTGTAGTNTYTAVWNADGDLVDGYDPTTKVNATSTQTLDFGGASEEIPNSTSDMALTTAGQVGLELTDDQFIFHGGAAGEIQGEAAHSLLQHFAISFDPKVVCDGDVDRLFLMTIGDDAPEGIIIVEWKLSFEADPTTEFGAGETLFKYADAFIGVANAATIDDVATSAGVSTEDTNANINSGAVVANSKVLYLDFPTAYTETGHQVIFEFWYYAEAD